MNICMVHHDLNPPFFEAVRRLGFELCRELAKQGHEVHVVTGFVKKEDSFPVEIEGVSFHRIPQSSFSRALPERLRRLHEEEKLHIIHFQNTLLSKRFIRPLSLIVRRIQVPTVAYMCMQPVVPLREFVSFAKLGSIVDELSLDPGYYIAGLLASRLLVRTEFNLVRHVVASSDYIRNQLVRIGVPREKTEVVYPYVDINRFVGTIDRDPRGELTIDKNDPMVLYVGPVQSIRLGVFLTALSLVAESTRNLKIVLVAKYVSHKMLARLADKNLKPLVRLLTDVRRDIAAIIATSDAYVFPGFSSFASIDPPLSLVEAAILGVPVLASATGGIPEIAENITLVHPFDHIGMAKELGRILNQRQSVPSFETKLRNLRRARYPACAERFDVRSAAQRFLAIYENIQFGRVEG